MKVTIPPKKMTGIFANEGICLTLIGMPSVGKSTAGHHLARELNFAPLDTDYVIEALYGVNLQQVTDSLSKDEFLDLESEVICKIDVKRTIISTGGSVVYRDACMQHLKKMGPCIFLSAPLDLLLERISRHPDRGIAIAPGQTIEDLYEERMQLYTKYADYTIEVDNTTSPTSIAENIINHFSKV